MTTDPREAHEMRAEQEKRKEAIEMAKRCANDQRCLVDDWGDAEITYQGVAYIGQELIRLEAELDRREKEHQEEIAKLRNGRTLYMSGIEEGKRQCARDISNAKAEVWDEGCSAAYVRISYGLSDVPPNPYRDADGE